MISETDKKIILSLARNAALTRLAEHLQQGENTRFVVTNLAGGYPFKELFACVLARLRSQIPAVASG